MTEYTACEDPAESNVVFSWTLKVMNSELEFKVVRSNLSIQGSETILLYSDLFLSCSLNNCLMVQSPRLNVAPSPGNFPPLCSRTLWCSARLLHRLVLCLPLAPFGALLASIAPFCAQCFDSCTLWCSAGLLHPFVL